MDLALTMCNIFTTFILRVVAGNLHPDYFYNLIVPGRVRRNENPDPYFYCQGDQRPEKCLLTYPGVPTNAIGWEKNGMGPAAPTSRRPRYKWAKKDDEEGVEGEREMCILETTNFPLLFFATGARLGRLLPPPSFQSVYSSTHGGSDRKAGRKTGGRVQFFKKRSRRRRPYFCSGKEEEVFLKSAPLSSLSASFFWRGSRS